MPVTDVTHDLDTRTLTIVAEFAAPAARIWQVYADPRQLEKVFGPPTYPATFVDHDLTPGGTAHYFMTSPEGEKYDGWWKVTAVDEPRSFAFEDGFARRQLHAGGRTCRCRRTCTLRGDDAGTRATYMSTYDSAEALQKVLDMGVIEGASSAIEQIDDVIAEVGRARVDGRRVQHPRRLRRRRPAIGPVLGLRHARPARVGARRARRGPRHADGRDDLPGDGPDRRRRRRPDVPADGRAPEDRVLHDPAAPADLGQHHDHRRAAGDRRRGAQGEADGLPMRTVGSPSLVRSLFRLGLVDRLRIMVFPMVHGAAGEGPLFADLPVLDLELTGTTVVDDRLVLLDYRVGED